MLPGLSGEDLIQRVRKKSTTPVIALTAKLNMDDKVKVLELGADDYMTKPFEPRELLARVGVQLRRRSIFPAQGNMEPFRDEALSLRDLFLYRDSRTVVLLGQPIELTAHEFDILRTMMENPARVFSKESLYEAVWKNGYYGEDNTISVHISNIRKKIAKITSEEYISTVWGIGYKLHL